MNLAVGLHQFKGQDALGLRFCTRSKTAAARYTW
jgi:hypothetical protein